MEFLESGAGSGWDGAVVVALGSNLAGDFSSSEALLEAALARLDQAGLPRPRAFHARTGLKFRTHRIEGHAIAILGHDFEQARTGLSCQHHLPLIGIGESRDYVLCSGILVLQNER